VDLKIRLSLTGKIRRPKARKQMQKKNKNKNKNKKKRKERKNYTGRYASIGHNR